MNNFQIKSSFFKKIILHFIRTFMLISSSFIFSCETLSYKEPLEGSRARVRFVTTTKGVTVLRAYADNNCSEDEAEWMRLADGYFVNSNPRVLGLPLNTYHENAAKEVYIVANRQINGLFTGNQKIDRKYPYVCGVSFHFTFIENRDYEVKFIANEGPCKVIISEIKRKGLDWSLLEVKYFMGIKEENKGCLEQSQKIRLY